ncbi:MAG TPA: sigma-70 family RNA polymerase sigma factor [Bryobacteraceae bacterium]|jgi:RNA polymerase sigma factor (TIGR02999 family)|nr:sigma-70 family RNA polymerase sigma factor [Bryobacteraceae bacterium]
MAASSSDERVARATQVFEELRASGRSSEDIFVTLYGDLKQLARQKIGRRPPGASMHASRLMSDLYLRLFGRESADFEWDSARHFFNTMALAMEQLLIDYARQFKSRGRDRTNSLDALAAEGFQPADSANAVPQGRNLSQENVEQAVFVKELLDRLVDDAAAEGKSRIAERQAEIVRLRVFLGLSEDEVAEVLGCSSETITKEFRKAKAKLASLVRREGDRN